MKYNSIGEQLIAKAKKIDPSYKSDKFNDMSEALDIILNNSSTKLYLDIAPYVTLEEGEEMNLTITQEGVNLMKTKIEKGEIIGIILEKMPFLYSFSNDSVLIFTLNMIDTMMYLIINTDVLAGSVLSESPVKVPEPPRDDWNKTYTLQATNGNLNWTDPISEIKASLGEINTILDNINGESI